MLAAFVPIPRSTPAHGSLSLARTLSGPIPFGLRPIVVEPRSLTNLTVRMGGGPRTYPGGVSKWQWKRMQAKKAKQLLKARLCRERQLYEMRKRTELKAAVSELERPWEVVERAPKLFSVSADEQLKVLADRFQKPGGFDMWSERDGPQVFCTPDQLPSARFFPKGVVHSVKPYGIAPKSSESDKLDRLGDREELRFDDWIARGAGGTSSRSRRSSNRTGRERWETLESKTLVEESAQVAENTLSKHAVIRESNAGEDQRLSEKGVPHARRDPVSRNGGNNRNEIEQGLEHSFRSNLGAKAAGKEGSSSSTNRGRRGGSNRRFKGRTISLLRPSTDLFLEEEA